MSRLSESGLVTGLALGADALRQRPFQNWNVWRPGSAFGTCAQKIRKLEHANEEGHMRTSVLILAIVSLLSPRESDAQAPEVLAPKTRIRYALPTDRRAIIAEVVVHRGDSLWVRRTQSADTVVLALSTLAQLDVSRGRQGRALRGAGIGLLSGVVVGGAIGYAAGDADCSGKFVCYDKPQAAAGGAAIFGLLGAGIGALIGRESRTDRWEPALLTSRGRIATWSGRRGSGYGLRFSYSVF